MNNVSYRKVCPDKYREYLVYIPIKISTKSKYNRHHIVNFKRKETLYTVTELNYTADVNISFKFSASKPKSLPNY